MPPEQYRSAMPARSIALVIDAATETLGPVLTALEENGMTVLIAVRPWRDGENESELVEEFGLTQREAEVLVWLSRGKTNRDIADILELSARTVNKHLETVFQKMGADDRTSAAVMADRVLQPLSQ